MGSLFIIGEIHQNETGGIPYFIGKVAACLNLLFAVTHIVSGAVAGGESESQSVCAEFVNYFKRINAVAERF